MAVRLFPFFFSFSLPPLADPTDPVEINKKLTVLSAWRVESAHSDT